MKQRLFEVIDCMGWLHHFIMAANIEEARDYEKNPDLIVVDPQECREKDIFSWQIYFILGICDGPVAASNYYSSMPRPHEVADQIKHNKFQNWYQTITI